MGTTHYPQHILLWNMAAIYMFAFSSLYFQVPGLYGKKGLLPAVAQLQPANLCRDSLVECQGWAELGECGNNPTYMQENCKKSCSTCNATQDQTFREKLKLKFTLLWLSPNLGLDTESGMELICILGTLLSAAVLIYPKLRIKIVYLSLWVLYFSLYRVGQIFLWYQWDILLLETGMLALFISPMKFTTPYESPPDNTLLFWLVKWLLFRLMFASGVVKLTSMCPTWWGLTALDWHYESQCIPTSLSWYAHQLPGWFQGLSVVGTFVIEIAMPFLFFSHIRSLRLVAFYSQVLLQFLIILTGNYNFFNLLTLNLCVSLIDDEFIFEKTPFFLKSWLGGKVFRKRVNSVSKKSLLSSFLHWLVMIILLVSATKLFNIKFENGVITSRISFTKDDFLQSLKTIIPITVYIGSLAFVIQLFKALYATFFIQMGKIKKIVRVLRCLWFSYIAVWLFGMSLVPFTELDTDTRNNVWLIFHKWYRKTDKYHVVNSYGLFRRMTGVGGRPELIIEGSNDIGGEWKEYEFLYKPGVVTKRPLFCAPHQPRLDWQMWFAALSSIEHHPWYVSLLYKILHGQEEVLNLMGRNPFPGAPPKYIRSRLFTYHFTKLVVNSSDESVIDNNNMSSPIGWWTREYVKDYSYALTKDDGVLAGFLQKNGLGPDYVDSLSEASSSLLSNVLFLVRRISHRANPTIFMFHLLFITIVINIFHL